MRVSTGELQIWGCPPRHAPRVVVNEVYICPNNSKIVGNGGFRTVGVGNAKADQIETGFSLSHSFIAISTLGRFEDEKGGNDQRLAISNLTLYC